MYGYFLVKQFSFSCFVLPESIQSYCFEAEIKRDIVFRDEATSSSASNSVPSDHINVTFENEDYPVQCSEMTESCALCVDDGGQAKCTECNPGYLLVGWTCKPCSEQFPDYNCDECSSSGCKSCSDPSMHVSMNGMCVKCKDEVEVFDETTKTCVGCGTMFSRCAKCNKDKCTACEAEGSFKLDEDTGACQTCSEIHGSGCTDCTMDKCKTCTSDMCCENGTKIVVDPVTKEGQCGDCSNFDKNCLNCTSTVCTKCVDEGMFIHPDTGKCVSCSDQFQNCGKCTADVCTACIKPDSKAWILTNDGCAQVENVVEEEPSSLSQQQPQQSVPSSSRHASSSQQPVVTPSPTPEDDGGSNAGMIVGIVIGCLAFVAIVGVAVYFFVTRGAKHGKIDSEIFEEDPNFVSMSVL